MFEGRSEGLHRCGHLFQPANENVRRNPTSLRIATRLGIGDLRATLEAIRPFRPLTIFHEPINIRADNAERIAERAEKIGVKLKTEVFANPSSWRAYAVEQLTMVQRIAAELGMSDHLHLWPDKSLLSKGGFIRARQFAFRQANPDYRETAYEKGLRRVADEAAYVEFERWISAWHARISEWPNNEGEN